MKRVVRYRQSLGLGALGLFACACGSSASPWGKPEPTSMEGRVAIASFPVRPTAFVAEDEVGNQVRVPLGETGTFVMTLPSQHQYELRVETERDAARVILPRASGRIDRAFDLKTTQADIALGTIRYISPTSAEPAVASSGQCDDGLRADGAGLCTITADRSQCFDGYSSEAPATCNDLDLVLGYGTLGEITNGRTAGPFAVAAQSPPCEVNGCNVPDLPNPPQSPND